MLLEPFECGITPCIDPSFPGPTKISAYWTSKSSQSEPTKAYGVFFNWLLPGVAGYSIGKAVMGLRVVKQSDGHLAIESEMGKGSTFTVSIPSVYHS